MTADEIVARASQLFAERLPDTLMPDPGEFHRWLAKGGGDGAALFRAIERASGKLRAEGRSGHEMDSNGVAAFVIRILRTPNYRKKTSLGNRGFTK
jgi:hypothetical protein